jgi:hypothetical protein
MGGIDGLRYFRYADDMLALTGRREACIEAAHLFETR